MTQQVAPLDAGELTRWLTQLTQSADRSLREPTRSKAAAILRDGLDSDDKLVLPMLIQLAFLADCLYVSHLAIYADGRAEATELERVADLVRVAAPRYFLALPAYEAFDDGVATPAEVARFLEQHHDDPGPFGFQRAAELRGLTVTRLIEQATRNAAPLQDHERMLSRIMEAVFAGRATEAEHVARRRLRDLFEQPGSSSLDMDPRAVAFCRSDGPEVFSSVAHGSNFHARDPFDVESIHAEVRRVFHQQVERATTPAESQSGHGRTLLILGESGAGKTHLLRALRAQVHGRRLGYVGYLQLTPEADDHARHVLRSLIDSLEQPYDAPSLAESGLMYLSDGLVEARDTVSPDELERLRTAELSAPELEQFIGALVDRIARSEGMERLEVDLVHALLLLQRRDPALQRRIVRFLRCDSLTQYDRQLLGGLGAREHAGDPLRTIQQLAVVMYELQLAALVIVVDQVEEAVSDGKTITRLQPALDSLRAIADAIPSSVVVISCLVDVYDAVKTKLSQALLDRLSRDEVRLTTQRQPAEIEQMLVRRLEHLYSYFDVVWRDDDPLYPFRPAQIEAVSQWRTRDVLGKFGEFHKTCIAAGQVVSVTKGLPPPPPPPPPPSLDKLWQETLAASVAPPDTEVLALVADSLRGAALERGLALEARL
ncbi:MAG: AAA family ATPase, partial [Kofleriaceae bacterium]